LVSTVKVDSTMAGVSSFSEGLVSFWAKLVESNAGQTARANSASRRAVVGLDGVGCIVDGANFRANARSADKKQNLASREDNFNATAR
jgi:hypothetical protein